MPQIEFCAIVTQSVEFSFQYVFYFLLSFFCLLKPLVLKKKTYSYVKSKNKNNNSNLIINDSIINYIF